MALFGLLPDGVAQAGAMLSEDDLKTFAPKSRGFGGGLRDVFGRLGDALLTAHGRDPQYAIGKAMENYDEDPLGSIQDVYRASPSRGKEMLAQYYANLKQQAEEKRLSAKDALDARESNNKNQDRAYDMYAGLASGGTAETWGVRKKVMEEIAARTGVPIPVAISDTYDPALGQTLTDIVLQRKDAASLEETRRYHDIVQRKDAASLEETRRYHDITTTQTAKKDKVAAIQKASQIGIQAGRLRLAAARPPKNTGGKGIPRPSVGGPKKKFVVQNGVTYTLQPDGSYK